MRVVAQLATLAGFRYPDNLLSPRHHPFNWETVDATCLRALFPIECFALDDNGSSK